MGWKSKAKKAAKKGYKKTKKKGKKAVRKAANGVGKTVEKGVDQAFDHWADYTDPGPPPPIECRLGPVQPLAQQGPMGTNTTCPRCGGGIPSDNEVGAHWGALSRYDSRTEVCSPCGEMEAEYEVYYTQLPPPNYVIARVEPPLVDTD